MFLFHYRGLYFSVIIIIIIIIIIISHNFLLLLSIGPDCFIRLLFPFLLLPVGGWLMAQLSYRRVLSLWESQNVFMYCQKCVSVTSKKRETFEVPLRIGSPPQFSCLKPTKPGMAYENLCEWNT